MIGFGCCYSFELVMIPPCCFPIDSLPVYKAIFLLRVIVEDPYVEERLLAIHLLLDREEKPKIKFYSVLYHPLNFGRSVQARHVGSKGNATLPECQIVDPLPIRFYNLAVGELGGKIEPA